VVCEKCGEHIDCDSNCEERHEVLQVSA
jgi:hypothetical protein